MNIQPAQTAPHAADPNDRLRRASEELEAAFLAEMLKSAGMGKVQGSFSGGAGEEQFASFLVTEQARAMVRAGGIGLAESIFRQLAEATHDE